jgi:hypothetical protein
MSESSSEDEHSNMIESSSEEEESIKCHINKQRLANAVAMIKTLKSAATEFAWGEEIAGIDGLMKTLHVESLGDIPVPVSTQVLNQCGNLVYKRRSL